MRTLNFFIFVFISIVLVGCASHKEATTSNTFQNHVESGISSRIDSVFLHDSVQVHDSVFIAVLGDTVYKEKFHTVYRDRIQYKYKLKTDTLIVKDTISAVYTETVSSPSQEISLWDRARIKLANLTICILLFACGAWLLNKKKIG